MRVWVCANTKGGTGKTTSTAFLAATLAERGHRVVCVDTDPQMSLHRWAELGEWPVPVVALPTNRIHSQLRQVIDPDRWDYAVVDTPGWDREKGITASALRAADLALIPMAPTVMDVDAAEVAAAILADVAPLRAEPLPAHVLLCRVNPRTKAREWLRDALTDRGWHVLTTELPTQERYAQALGTWPKPTPAFHAVIDELTTTARTRQKKASR